MDDTLKAINEELERRKKERGTPQLNQGPKDKAQDNKARAQTNKLTKAQIENSKKNFERALEHRKKGEFDKAIGLHTSALTALPKTDEYRSIRAEAYLDRGRAHTARKQYDLAIADYTEVLKLNPRETKALNNRGNAYKRIKQFDKALADLTAAIKIKPKDYVLYYNRGIAYREKGEYERAIADLDRALGLNPNDASSHYNRGFTYYKKGSYDDAISDYDRAIKLNPKMWGAYRNRGYAFAMLGEEARAKADYAKARELNPRIAINPPSPDAAKPAAKTTGNSASSELDLAFWNDVKNSNDPDMLQAYLEEFPNGTFARLARVKLQKLKKAR